MGIEKITHKVSELSQEGLKKLPKAGKKIDTVVENGSKKLTGALDSMAQSMKARVALQNAKKIKAKKAIQPQDIIPKKAQNKTIDYAIKKAIPIDEIEKTNAAKELSHIQKLSGKSANESASVFLNKFEEKNALKELNRVRKLTGKSAEDSAVWFMVNGRTDAEKIAQQTELKAKLMDKYGDKLAQKQHLAQTKARLQEKYQK